MRAIENGESFVLTRNGTPIADLVPHARSARTRRASGKDIMAAAARLPKIDVERFWVDLDSVVDSDPLRGPGEPEQHEVR
jgi:antitoxin (DNA-binding transcriptional repressor) of toxin-antitoxin stability system